MPTAQLTERRTESRARPGAIRRGVTGTLERKAWSTDALVRTPDKPLLAQPELLATQPVPQEDRDRLMAEQFAQLRDDLVFTLGEMGVSAWNAASLVWQTVILGPSLAALSWLNRWCWRALAALATAIGVTLRLTLRGLRFAGAVVLDFMLLILELVDGEPQGAAEPAPQAAPIIVPDEPRLANLNAARIRLLDRRSLPFGSGADDNHDYQIRQALEDIRRMSSFAQGLPVPTDGPFAGMKMPDALLTVTPYDLYAFFRHLLSQPDLYQGKVLKLAETYALWVLQGAPRPEIPLRKN